MFQLRDAQASDAAAIAEIYGHYVRTTCFTFEEAAPSVDEIGVRMRKVGDAGLPYIVAEAAGVVVGYAYAGPFHTRSAYRFTLENSVYVAPDQLRQGIATALMRRLIAECGARGYRQMLARIGDRDNMASVALHAKLGFRSAGELRAVGFKLGRWLDVMEMQLALQAP